MAALQSIRGRAGLLVTVLGIALLAFILGDLLSSGTTILNKQKDNAFSIDGDVITTGKYQERVDQMEGFQKMMMSKSSFDEQEMASIREMVYQQIVKERVLDAQAEKLGLAVTAKELTDLVYGDNKSPIIYSIFSNPQTGEFEQQMMEYFLEGIRRDTKTMTEEEKMYHEVNKSAWLTIENMIKYNRLEEKYASLISGTVLTNDIEINSSMNDMKNEATIAYTMKYYTSIPDSAVVVSDAEIKALYDKRKNNYKVDGNRSKISYFIKDVIPSEEDFAAVETEMNASVEALHTTTNVADVVASFAGNQYIDAYRAVSALSPEAKSFVESASIGEVYGPIRRGQEYSAYKLIDKTVGADSVQLQVISIPQQLDMQVREQLIDSLHTVIKGGKNFADVANELNPQSNGGMQPMLDEMNLIASGISKDAVYAPVGSVSKIKLSGQSLLVRVVAKSAPVSKVKLAIIEMPVIISNKTQDIIDNELIEFINASGNIENFNTTAIAKGYSLMPNVPLESSIPLLNNVPGTRPVIHWAFNEDIGAVKKFDTTDKRIVAIITDKIKAGYIPLDNDVKEGLKMELIRDKKAEKIISDMKAKNISSLEAYAEAMTAQVDTAKFISFATRQIPGIGFEPIFNAYSKLGTESKVSAPLKGEVAVYVFNIAEKKETGNVGLTTEIAKDNIGRQLRSEIAQGATQALVQKMNVVDNRVSFW